MLRTLQAWNCDKEDPMNTENKERDIPFISTEMTSADIYLQGAVLHRHGTISLTRGRNRFGVKIPDYLPYAIEDPRIEFGGKTEHCTISTPVEAEKHEESVEIEEGQLRLSRVEAEILSYESSLKLLEDVGKFGNGMTLSPTDFVNMADLVSEKQIEIRKRIVRLQKLKTDLEIELLELRKKNEETEKCSEIYIDLIAPEDAVCGFELTYRVRPVTWEPFYEIIYQDMQSPLTVNLRGKLVRQGKETWENIRLRLIHGTAGNRHDLPDPKVLRVGFRRPSAQPSIPYYRTSGPAASDSSSAGFSRFAAAEPSPDPNDTVYPAPSARQESASMRMKASAPLQVEKTQVTRELSVRFNLGETHTISEDMTVLDIQEQSVPAEYRYTTVPFMDPSVYLTGKIKDFVNYNFISCEARLYAGSTYIGSTEIPDGEDELVFSLGRDEALDAKKERTGKKHVEPRLAREQSDQNRFRITLSNHRDETVSVQVIDRLPLSKEQEVRVIMESASENPHFDEETGRLTWDVTINAGAQKSIEYAYRVSYPKGKTISYEEDGHTW